MYHIFAVPEIKKRRNVSVSPMGPTILAVNNIQVDSTYLDYFYKAAQMSFLFGCAAILTFLPLSKDINADSNGNMWMGCCIVFFSSIIIFHLPSMSSPISRPHPIHWRIVLGCSIIHLFIVQFLMHQRHTAVQSVILWFDPSMTNYTLDTASEYSKPKECWDVTINRILDQGMWAFSHYLGFVITAIVMRHYGVCWCISIIWELTELAFGHHIPGLYECWWDSIFIDILLCNGLGIFTGMQICRWMELCEHSWELAATNVDCDNSKIIGTLIGVDAPNSSNLVVRWSHSVCCGLMRHFPIFILVISYQIAQLNTFLFISHNFPMPAKHPISVLHLLLLYLESAPTVHQYYNYVTDRRCEHLGKQVWIFVSIMVSETVFNIKFAWDMLSEIQISILVLWLLATLSVSIIGMIVSKEIYRWKILASDYGK